MLTANAKQIKVIIVKRTTPSAYEDNAVMSSAVEILLAQKTTMYAFKAAETTNILKVALRKKRPTLFVCLYILMSFYTASIVASRLV